MTRLLNIRPGEAKKLALLYGLHFVFYVGLRWGDNSGYILFLNSWDAIAMSLIFMVQAALGLTVGLLYTAFAGTRRSP